MDDLSNANIIKGYLIDLFHNSADQELFGSEVMFGSNGRFADLLYITNLIIAFEIKAQNDDFRNIRQQLNDYKKIFDKMYLVITENHFLKAKKVVTNNEGIIIIKDNYNIEVYKEAKQIKRHNKTEIIETINASFIQNYFNIIGKYSAKEIRNKIKTCDISELESALYDFFKQKIISKNSLFFSEKGIKTHFEDVALLSFNNETTLF